MSIARSCPHSEEKDNCKFETYYGHPRLEKCSTCNRIKKEPTEPSTQKMEISIGEKN